MSHRIEFFDEIGANRTEEIAELQHFFTDWPNQCEHKIHFRDRFAGTTVCCANRGSDKIQVGQERLAERCGQDDGRSGLPRREETLVVDTAANRKP